MEQSTKRHRLVFKTVKQLFVKVLQTEPGGLLRRDATQRALNPLAQESRQQVNQIAAHQYIPRRKGLHSKLVRAESAHILQEERQIV